MWHECCGLTRVSGVGIFSRDPAAVFPGLLRFPLDLPVAGPVGKAGDLGLTCRGLQADGLQEGSLTSERGFTVIDLIVVLIMVAVVATIVLPRAIRSSPQLQVDLAARTMTRDLETLRMRAIAAKRHVRVRFAESGNYYTAFMDVTPDRLGVIAESEDEVRETGLLIRGSVDGLPAVSLPSGVQFGTGALLRGPQGADASAPIALEGGELEFDARGMVAPPGSGGVVYLVHEDEPSAVSAVTISGAGALRAWRYRNGIWIK